MLSCKSAVILEKSNYGLKLSITLMFLTIYGVEKSQCDRSKQQGVADSLRKVCWQYWLNLSHAVTFFSVRISDSMKIDLMMRTCTLT